MPSFPATAIPLSSVPDTANGTLELFEFSAADGSEINKVVIAVVFGRALVDPNIGFAQHTVAPGDTLSAIAQQFYGDSSLWPRIHDANRDQIANPNVIYVGQVLRVPQ